MGACGARQAAVVRLLSRTPGWAQGRRPCGPALVLGVSIAACCVAGFIAEGVGEARAQAPQSAPHPPLQSPGAVPDAPKSLGSINGTVNDATGVPIAGAHVALSAGAQGQAAETISDLDGHFRFSGVRPGAFTVMVRLDGFNTASAAGTLQPGQTYPLPPFSLSLATVSVTVDAVVSTEEVALEDMHAEEQQRLIGWIPNFYVTYDWKAPALTPKQKFSLATRNVIDPGNLALVGVVAGVEQAENAYPGYSQGAKGYGRRYGAALGNLVSGTYMGGAVLPVLFHQDPRYFYKGTGTKRQRFLYAVSTAVICRGDNGKREPAFASVLGDLSAGAISNLYYAPSDRQGARLTLENGLLGIAGDAMNNVFQEFVLRHFTPKAEKHP